MSPRNPFAVLGLPFDATTDAIKAAWRRLAREHHPDVTSGDEVLERRATRRMAEINAAYQELRDPQKRRIHREEAARQTRAERAARGEHEAPRHSDGNGANPFPNGSYGSWVPRPRPTRPVTARIDTSAVFRPRNTTLQDLPRSPLPGLPPRSHHDHLREHPRASDPTGPALRHQGSPVVDGLPSLAEALATELTFGKFQGHTLQEVAGFEPSYIDWIVRTIVRDPDLLGAARVVQRYLERTGAARRRRMDASPSQSYR